MPNAQSLKILVAKLIDNYLILPCSIINEVVLFHSLQDGLSCFVDQAIGTMTWRQKKIATYNFCGQTMKNTNRVLVLRTNQQNHQQHYFGVTVGESVEVMTIHQSELITLDAPEDDLIAYHVELHGHSMIIPNLVQLEQRLFLNSQH